MPKKLSTQEFIERSLIIHKGLYDYSKSNYQGSLNKIIIICPIHGEFQQLPKNHLKGSICNFCANKNRSTSGNKQRTLTIEEFIKRSTEKHNNVYDYSLVNYTSGKNKITIICKNHGQFEQRASEHISGSGCKKCADDLKRSNTNDFIDDCKKVHDNKYIYSATTYVSAYSKVIITCPKHGDFKQIAYTHKYGNGCPICKDSKGEREIKMFLDKNNIKYDCQKIFIDCKNIRVLPFDFYLSEHNMCIEYDGQQHYKPTGFSNSQEKFELVKFCDKIKNEYCTNNNIKLIRIGYKDNIELSLRFLRMSLLENKYIYNGRT